MIKDEHAQFRFNNDCSCKFSIGIQTTTLSQQKPRMTPKQVETAAQLWAERNRTVMTIQTRASTAMQAQVTTHSNSPGVHNIKLQKQTKLAGQTKFQERNKILKRKVSY